MMSLQIFKKACEVDMPHGILSVDTEGYIDLKYLQIYTKLH